MNLKEMLVEKKTIAVQQHAADWKEAVRISTDLMVKAGIVEERYYESILHFTAEYGPYYVLAPGLAMPHARPEGGVIETGFSLVTLAKPVEFGNEINDPVDILITLAAADNVSHTSAIAQVVSVFSVEENVRKIREAQSVEEIIELLSGQGE